MPRALREYHFDMGNTSVGAVGYAARIAGTTRQEAVNRLRLLVANGEAEIRFSDRKSRGEYLTVYFNLERITVEEAFEPECAACGESLDEDVDECPSCSKKGS